LPLIFPEKTLMTELLSNYLGGRWQTGTGRAGGGEELGGLRALNSFHCRSTVQASTAVLAPLQTPAA
jgi:3,4-dehydroadipyl-CoA semialdehyde dehydrogenase